MDLTPYHAKCYAFELTKRCPIDSVEKLAGALVDAQDDIDRRREQLITEIEGQVATTSVADAAIFYSLEFSMIPKFRIPSLVGKQGGGSA